ncbi:MAG: hypothetical protein JWQ97_2858 [Phenylobacterium sp.]|nr:hypothetical protein [Phenylobacterium sp.]
MAFVTLYGLDENRRVIATEIFAARDDGLSAFAEQHLERFAAIEVWEGRRCRLRVERRTRAHPSGW